MSKLEKITKHFPGMRIIKTALALLICALINHLRNSPASYQAGISAVVCMQHSMSTTLRSSVNRATGTLVSGIYAYFFMRFATEILQLHPGSLIYSITVSVFVIPLMYLLVKLKKPGSVAIACIVFLIICIPVGQDPPLSYTVTRVTDTLIGIASVIFVEWFPPIRKFSELYIKTMKLEVPEDIKKDLEGK